MKCLLAIRFINIVTVSVHFTVSLLAFLGSLSDIIFKSSNLFFDNLLLLLLLLYHLYAACYYCKQNVKYVAESFF